MSCRFEEGKYYCWRQDTRGKLVAYSVRDDYDNRLMLICPCEDTINLLTSSDITNNEYYLGKIWSVSND